MQSLHQIPCQKNDNRSKNRVKIDVSHRFNFATICFYLIFYVFSLAYFLQFHTHSLGGKMKLLWIMTLLVVGVSWLMAAQPAYAKKKSLPVLNPEIEKLMIESRLPR